MAFLPAFNARKGSQDTKKSRENEHSYATNWQWMHQSLHTTPISTYTQSMQ